MVCTQFQTKPRVLRSDNGREYVNSNFHQFLTNKGLIHQTSCPNTPQENDVAESKNRTLLEMTRTIMLESLVPTYLWPKAIAATNYLTNRLPTKALNYKTPLEALQLYQPIPSSHFLPPRIFGCIAYVRCPKRVRNKLESRAVKCLFVGYRRIKRGIGVMNPQNDECIPLWIVSFLNKPIITPSLILRGRHVVMT